MTNEEDAPVHDEGEMCCCRENVKVCCATYIKVVSGVVIVLSLLSGIYGYLAITGSEASKIPVPKEYKTKFEVPQNTGFAYAALGGMVIGILVGIFGCVAAYCRTAWFAIPFGLIAFIIGILNIAVGAGIFSGAVDEGLIKIACEDKHAEFDNKSGTQFMKEQLSTSVDALMCTDTCPCLESEYKIKYATYSAADLAPFNRVPTTSAGSGNDKMIVTAANAFKSWGQCYNATLKDATGSKSGVDTNSKSFKDFVKNGGVQFLGSLEDAFDCAGLCYTPLFYLKKNIAVGRPTQDCARAAVAKFGSNTGAGIAAVVTGLVFFTAFLGSIPLCNGFPASGDDGKAF